MKLTKFLTTQFAYIANSNDIFILLKLPLKFKSIFSPSFMPLNHPNRPTNGALVQICSFEPFNHKSDAVQFRQNILCACGIKMRLTLNGKTTPFSRRYISHIPFFPLLSSHKNLDAHLFVRQKFHEEYLVFFFVFVSQNFVCKPYRYICLTHTLRMKYVNISITSQANE